ncbi:MAG: serine hydrolase domain-containing protein, partial [Gemmatimonadaceae bacterium]
MTVHTERPAHVLSALTLSVTLALALIGAPAARAQATEQTQREPMRATLTRPGTLDSTMLAAAYTRAAQLPRLRSLLVSHDGRLVGERYFNGARRSSRANIKSASKSIISALVGIAIREGRIRSVHQPIGDFLSAQMSPPADPRVREISIEDLLTMRSGLETTSFENYGRWVTSRNWVRHVLTRRMVAEPGGAMIYSTGSTHLLSAILARATGMSTWQYANRKLAQPLGFSISRWRTDPQGVYFGGNDMYLTPRE